MNNHWQYGLPNSTARIDDEQGRQSFSYWGCPAWSENALYASIPWLGIGGTTLPAYASSPSSSCTFYPSSSVTVYPSSSATTVSETQQQLPIKESHLNAVFESAQPAELKREVETDHNRRSSISLQVDELISALMPLPQSASSSGTEAGTDFCAVESFERPEAALSSPRLDSLNINEITSSQAIFYFGVLAIQSLLLPRFHYSKDHGGKKWACTLTMYGRTIVRSFLFETQMEARIEVCWEALKGLQSQFPGWLVPYEPEGGSNSPGWNWVELLQDYCVQNGLRNPQYTQYIHEGNYRHEVEVEGGSFFGLQKQCPDALSSKNAAAHMALHVLLVYGNSVLDFPGPFTMKMSRESLFAHVPKFPSRACAISSSPESPDRRGAIKKKQRTRSHHKKLSPRKNANLLPLTESKLPDLEMNPVKEKRRWNISPSELQNRLKNLPTPFARLKKACRLLSLQPPEIRITRLDGCPVDTEGEYRTSAHFKGDPFLTRAGAIGSTKGQRASKAAAKELCAAEVVRYLIKMVSEDTELEEEEAAKREQPKHWQENTLRMYASQGFVGC
ncbi:uncharacterized protein ACHE_70595A [Aspergillus chevalieri]|uniref:Uncharacterized protein n=1 Tax=Aspergillus chevalieri TaxID=182096 RepID=A0A7R7VVU7_ASPCH|nr:uncharacterized protein ACHE_70595A [Aspergillus chevalieri]BCR91752.1 hypothetical protein ACHE_70595A [Aspergillus chevalieri]